jgi:hypothetical protein
MRAFKFDLPYYVRALRAIPDRKSGWICANIACGRRLLKLRNWESEAYHIRQTVWIFRQATFGSLISSKKT